MHLAPAATEPDVVFSAVQSPAGSGQRPVLSLYVGCENALRTLSDEVLLHAFLSELRGRALATASDRVFLKMPAVRISGAGVLLPPFALRRLVRLEGAAARAKTELIAAPALTIDLRTGRPISAFAPAGVGLDGSSIESIDAIAVRRTPEGRLPSRAEVLSELAQHASNLRSVGAEGFEALGLLVERAQLIEWDEIRPQSMFERLAEKSLVMKRAG